MTEHMFAYAPGSVVSAQAARWSIDRKGRVLEGPGDRDRSLRSLYLSSRLPWPRSLVRP